MPRTRTSLREEKRKTMKLAALSAARTQAFNWALSVGFDKTRIRYNRLDELHAELSKQWKAVYHTADPVKYELDARLATIEAQMHGLIDAGERRGWTEQ